MLLRYFRFLLAIDNNLTGARFANSLPRQRFHGVHRKESLFLFRSRHLSRSLAYPQHFAASHMVWNN